MSCSHRHAREQEEAKKKKAAKKRKAAEAVGEPAPGPSAPDQPEWVGKHPWRPFDREADFAAGLSSKPDAKKLIANAKGLNSRFAGGAAQGQRSFL